MITVSQIKAARALLDWTQRDLARVSGISLAAIAQIERGAGNPRAETLRTLQQAFEKYEIEFTDEPGVRFRREPFAVTVWQGREAMLKVWKDIETTFGDGRGGELLLSCVDDPLWMSFYPKEMHTMFAARTALRITTRGLLAKAEDNRSAWSKDNYRLVPKKALAAHAPYYVYADKVAIIKLMDPIRIILIRNPTLAESFRGQFWYLWETGKRL